MQTLKFIVNNHTITLDPECEKMDLIPGTRSQLQAEFVFSSDWNNSMKVAAFYSNLGREFEPRVLKNGKMCDIPAEALKKSIFKVRVFGEKNGQPFSTNKVTVYQRGGIA